MCKLSAVLFLGACFLLPGLAHAYIGPGAGLSLLGALWALIVAIGTAVVFVVAWPIRKLRRRRREAKERAEATRDAGEQKPPAPDAPPADTPPAADRDDRGRRLQQQ